METGWSARREEEREGRWRRRVPAAGQEKAGASASALTHIAKHVEIENQVLRWLQDFSDRVEERERAKGAAAEMNGLLEEAGTLELDMKTAVLAFDNLTTQRFTNMMLGMKIMST